MLVRSYDEVAHKATAWGAAEGEVVERGWQMYCPACRYNHHFRTWVHPKRPPPTGKPRWPLWSFDGNEAAPTFKPSIRLLGSAPGVNQNGKWIETGPVPTLCHLVITKGVLHYCGDCPHAFRSKSIPMVELSA